VVLFGILALVAQFFYWADIVKKLNDRLVEGCGHRKADKSVPYLLQTHDL